MLGKHIHSEWLLLTAPRLWQGKEGTQNQEKIKLARTPTTTTGADHQCQQHKSPYKLQYRQMKTIQSKK